MSIVDIQTGVVVDRPNCDRASLAADPPIRPTPTDIHSTPRFSNSYVIPFTLVSVQKSDDGDIHVELYIEHQEFVRLGIGDAINDLLITQIGQRDVLVTHLRIGQVARIPVGGCLSGCQIARKFNGGG